MTREALRSSNSALDESSLKALVRSLPDGCLLLNQQLDLVEYNDSFVALTGERRRSLERLLDEGVRWFELVAQTPEIERERAVGCLKEGRPVHLADVSVHNRRGDSFIVFQSYVPVLSWEGKSLYVIRVLRDMTAENRMHGNLKQLLAQERRRAEELEETVAARTAELRAALAEVTRLSTVDPLTGVLNRRAFSERADRAINLAGRHGYPVSILMCDLDHFKRVNDTYGHQAGDRLLVATASMLGRCLRGTDDVARYGGEEFIVLLRYTAKKDAGSVARRFVNNARALPVDELLGNHCERQTLSVGVACFPDDGRSLEELVRAADSALYRAKAGGRDRYEIHDLER